MLTCRFSLPSEQGISPCGWAISRLFLGVRLSLLGLGIAVAGAGLTLSANTVRAADAPGTPTTEISFYRQVRPILQRNCSGCHQPSKAGGKFILTDFAGLLAGGEQGAGIVAGKPDESSVIDNITGEKPAMPPKGPPLPKEQVELITKWIAQGARDDTPKGLTDSITKDNPPVYSRPPLVAGLAWSPDSSLLAISGSHEVLIHKGDGSGLVARLIGRSQRITSVTFSPDGKLLAVTGGNPALFGEVQFWNTADWTLARTATATNDTLFGGRFSDDGSLFAFGGADNSARILRTADAEQTLKFDAHADWVAGTAFSKDGKHMITISRDRSMKLSIVETGQFVDNITSITPGALKGGLLALRRHPQRDELLIGGADGEPKLYKMIRTQARVIGDDFNKIRGYQPLPGRIYCLDFNADGSRFVVGSSTGDTGTVRVYQTEDAKLLHELKGHTRGVFSAAFAPNGKVIATGGFEGQVRLFDAETGALIKEFIPVTITPAVAGAGK